MLVAIAAVGVVAVRGVVAATGATTGAARGRIRFVVLCCVRFLVKESGKS